MEQGGVSRGETERFLGFHSTCAGERVRADITVTAYRHSPAEAEVVEDVRLSEGADCATADPTGHLAVNVVFDTDGGWVRTGYLVKSELSDSYVLGGAREVARTILGRFDDPGFSWAKTIKDSPICYEPTHRLELGAYDLECVPA